MKKSGWILAFLVAVAMPAAAQHNEFGVLFGGSKALQSPAGRGSFERGLREVYYGIALDPGTIFKVKLGRMDANTAFNTGLKDVNGRDIYESDSSGSIEHADGIIEYRFSEAYGYTGLFAGAGLYRQHGKGREESDYGFQGGINSIFPMSRRYALQLEGTYHVMNFNRPRPRYLTLAAGLRIAF
ncbi:MAG: hypothetical protein ABIP63_03035 [Thermoanaerobaculia bacterium]